MQICQIRKRIEEAVEAEEAVYAEEAEEAVEAVEAEKAEEAVEAEKAVEAIEAEKAEEAVEAEEALLEEICFCLMAKTFKLYSLRIVRSST